MEDVRFKQCMREPGMQDPARVWLPGGQEVPLPFIAKRATQAHSFEHLCPNDPSILG